MKNDGSLPGGGQGDGVLVSMIANDFRLEEQNRDTNT